MSRILVIEDDQLLNGGLCFNLQNAGYETIPVYDLKNAYPVVKSQKFDLMLLDVNLPDGNGFDFAREIQGFNQKPLIFLTAHELDEEVVEGFSLGADDYITKPFDPSQLIARVRSHLKRYARLTSDRDTGSKNKENQDQIAVADLIIEPKTWRVWKNGREIKLPNREFKLLCFLAENPNLVFSKEQLFEKIWGYDYVSDAATVSVHINRLREKIEDDARNPQIIETIWGAGYRLNL